MGTARALRPSAAVSLVNGDLHETAVKIGGITLHKRHRRINLALSSLYRYRDIAAIVEISRTPICADPVICASNLRIQHPHIRRPACKVFLLRASNTPDIVTGHFSFSRSLLRDIQVAIKEGNIPCISHLDRRLLTTDCVSLVAGVGMLYRLSTLGEIVGAFCGQRFDTRLLSAEWWW